MATKRGKLSRIETYFIDGNRKDMKNDRWTRVLTRDQVLIVGFNEHKLEEDLDEAWEEIVNVKHLASELWQPLFNPKLYEKPDVSQELDDYRLTADELEELGAYNTCIAPIKYSHKASSSNAVWCARLSIA